MIKKISASVRTLLFCLLFFPLTSGAIELSDSSRITTLTCAPGEELYSAFGHNGIRVTDFKEGWDVVFNYGTFDDEQPNFYPNFVKGRMIYSISYSSYGDFLSEYVNEKRGVVEQELRLTPEERKKIFTFLRQNALPENCNYAYDFFWDNCATRARDIFEKELGSRLEYHTDSSGFEQNKTMHDMLRLYVHDRPWVDFGFDLILGLPCEVAATPRNQTFLPDYYERLYTRATVDGQPFVIKTTKVLDYPLPVITEPFKPIHLTLILLLLGIIVTAIELKTGKHYFGFDFGVFLLSGIFGVFFACLWAFTTHYSLPKNMNMLWMVPSHFIVTFLLLRKNKPNWLYYYFLATAILMLVVLLGWRHIPQLYNLAFVPLVVLYGARALTIYLYGIKNTQYGDKRKSYTGQ